MVNSSRKDWKIVIEKGLKRCRIYLFVDVNNEEPNQTYNYLKHMETIGSVKHSKEM